MHDYTKTIAAKREREALRSAGVKLAFVFAIILLAEPIVELIL